MELEYTLESGVATILLNRPERKNAFTPDMLSRWAAALDDARTNRDVAVVVLRGAGGNFCSGVDLNSLETVGAEPIAQKRFVQEQVQRIPLAVADLDKPLIACVAGAAVGAGMDMALMCDMRFVGRSARFCESYLKVGGVPGAGGCYYLPRLVGVAKALELLLGGEFVDAVEALRIGLVNRMYEDDELVDSTYAFARQLASSPPIATAILKRATYQSMDCELRTALDLVSSHFGVLRSTKDSSEALRAFGEKRDPHYLNE